MNILIKNKLVVAIALVFVVSGAQASILVEDVAIDNSTYGTAQDVGTLSSGDLVKLLGFRGITLGGYFADDNNNADFYSFTLTSPAMLTLNVFTTRNDPILGLYDTHGTQLAFSDDGAADFDSFLKFDNLAAGTYIAAVSGYFDSNYSFSTADGDTNFLYNLQIETAAPIPLPLAVWTFGAGLVCMLTLSKRRKFV